MEIKQWSSCENWHELLDTICLDQGYIDNTELAGLCCARSKKEEEKEFISCVKNIGNWRSGKHLPSRGNFQSLTDVLKIREHKGLRAYWNRLYLEALHKQKNGAAPANEDQPGPAVDRRKGRHMFSRTSVIIGMAIVALTTFAVTSYFYRTKDLSTEYVAIENPNNLIPYRRIATMGVGEKLVVHGARSKCGRRPPSPSKIRTSLPQDLKFGKLDIGKFGVRFSRSCQDLTPAREILYHATKQGKETFFIYGDKIVVTVK